METVWLQRSSELVPWGFRMCGGRQNNQPLIVQRVTPGSVADSVLSSGDVLIKIGNVVASSLTQNEGEDLIRRAGNILQITIKPAPRDTAAKNYRATEYYSSPPSYASVFNQDDDGVPYYYKAGDHYTQNEQFDKNINRNQAHHLSNCYQEPHLPIQHSSYDLQRNQDLYNQNYRPSNWEPHQKNQQFINREFDPTDRNMLPQQHNVERSQLSQPNSGQWRNIEIQYTGLPSSSYHNTNTGQQMSPSSLSSCYVTNEPRKTVGYSPIPMNDFITMLDKECANECVSRPTSSSTEDSFIKSRNTASSKNYIEENTIDQRRKDVLKEPTVIFQAMTTTPEHNYDVFRNEFYGEPKANCKSGSFIKILTQSDNRNANYQSRPKAHVLSPEAYSTSNRDHVQHCDYAEFVPRFENDQPDERFQNKVRDVQNSPEYIQESVPNKSNWVATTINHSHDTFQSSPYNPRQLQRTPSFGSQQNPMYAAPSSIPDFTPSSKQMYLNDDIQQNCDFQEKTMPIFESSVQNSVTHPSANMPSYFEDTGINRPTPIAPPAPPPPPPPPAVVPPPPPPPPPLPAPDAQTSGTKKWQQNKPTVHANTAESEFTRHVVGPQHGQKSMAEEAAKKANSRDFTKIPDGVLSAMNKPGPKPFSYLGEVDLKEELKEMKERRRNPHSRPVMPRYYRGDLDSSRPTPSSSRQMRSTPSPQPYDSPTYRMLQTNNPDDENRYETDESLFRPALRQKERNPMENVEMKFSGLNHPRNVPSKMFKRLQNITGSGDVDDIEHNYDNEGRSDGETTNVRYMGDNIPSKAFRALQLAVDDKSDGAQQGSSHSNSDDSQSTGKTVEETATDF